MCRKRDVVFLDVDIPYSFFNEFMREFEEHVEWVCEKLGLRVIGYAVEQSTNGNTHVFLKLSEPVCDSEENHLAVAFGGSLALFLIAKRREKEIGSPFKVVFDNGKKKRLRKNA